MSTLDLLKKTGTIAEATSAALEDDVGATVVENEAELGSEDTVVLTPAEIKKMKLKDVNAAYESGAFGDVEGWADMSLTDKKAAMTAIVSTSDEDAVSDDGEQASGVVDEANFMAAPETPEEAEESEEAAEPVAAEPVAAEPVAQKVLSIAEDNDVIAQTIHEIENLKDASTALAKLQALEDEQSYSDFKMGGYLAVIQERSWFGDHPTFRAFVENETGIAYRKALYLIDIYSGLAESGIPWSRVSKVTWTKLKDLVHILTLENVDEWVAKALAVSTQQLQEDIAAYKKAQAGGQTPSPISAVENVVSTLSFKVHKDQKDIIGAAIDKAMKEGNTDVKTVALEYIATDFLAGTGKKKPKALDSTQGVTAEQAAGSVEASAYFKAMLVLAGEEQRLAVAEAILEAFDTVFPDVDLTVSFPA